ncbi:Dystrophin, isoform D-like Protein [Tribolium castaneum]|uniref:Dystrophin, isoform D-like Protein n=1 Tax=Tribolium castaneum TaxID=7070 RepID=A0A139WH13_TRICA|nr:hypothetical protein TcasGA2_TC033179 [Tribolium castaneum]KYB27291.1 Dystrophin, isoform D-like Protein [Tribolium castaneum]
MTVKTRVTAAGSRNCSVATPKTPTSWRSCAHGTPQAPRKTTPAKITTTTSTLPLTTTTPTKATMPNKITPITIRPSPIKARSDRRWVPPSDNTTASCAFRETPKSEQQSVLQQQHEQNNDNGEEIPNREGMSKETLQFEEALKQWVNR